MGEFNQEHNMKMKLKKKTQHEESVFHMDYEVLVTPVPALHAFVCEELQEAFRHSEQEKVDNDS